MLHDVSFSLLFGKRRLQGSETLYGYLLLFLNKCQPPKSAAS